MGNETAIYEDPNFIPEVIITYEKGEIESMNINDQKYILGKEVTNGKVWKLK